MDKGICRVSVAPVRAEKSHQSEMTSQLLYGESADILEREENVVRIKMHFDGFEGWVSKEQISAISDQDLAKRKTKILSEPFEIFDLEEGKILLSMGSELKTETDSPLKKPTSESISETAKQFLNVPYLWSGRSFFGIDCSGFVQIIFKIYGISLPRESHQQAEIGEVLSFVEESKPGDLAFFENSEGEISHVGICLLYTSRCV